MMLSQKDYGIGRDEHLELKMTANLDERSFTTLTTLEPKHLFGGGVGGGFKATYDNIENR